MQLGEGGRICYGGQASFDCSKKKERGGGLTASNKKGLGLDIRGQLLGKFQHFLFQFFSKQDEGSPYKDNTTGADLVDNAIAPGKIHNYVWEVPARAGPGPNDTDCLTWGYYSDVNPVKDTNTGLVGALVICRKVTLINRYWLRLRILASKASADGALVDLHIFSYRINRMHSKYFQLQSMSQYGHIGRFLPNLVMKYWDI